MTIDSYANAPMRNNHPRRGYDDLQAESAAAEIQRRDVPARAKVRRTAAEDQLPAGRGKRPHTQKGRGVILEIAPGDDALCAGPQGDSVRISYPITSIVGPQFGSARSIARRLKAAGGYLLALTLDASKRSQKARAVSPHDKGPSWDVVGELTGIENSCADSLAAAMDCLSRLMSSLLRRRGDEELAALIPRSAPARS